MPTISENVCLHKHTIERQFSKYYFTENFSLFLLSFALIALIVRFAYRLLFSNELLPINQILLRLYFNAKRFPFRALLPFTRVQNLYSDQINLFVDQYSLYTDYFFAKIQRNQKFVMNPHITQCAIHSFRFRFQFSIFRVYMHSLRLKYVRRFYNS